jgi:hypothetical protein
MNYRLLLRRVNISVVQNLIQVFLNIWGGSKKENQIYYIDYYGSGIESISSIATKISKNDYNRSLLEYIPTVLGTIFYVNHEISIIIEQVK